MWVDIPIRWLACFWSSPSSSERSTEPARQMTGDASFRGSVVYEPPVRPFFPVGEVFVRFGAKPRGICPQQQR